MATYLTGERANLGGKLTRRGATRDENRLAADMGFTPSCSTKPEA